MTTVTQITIDEFYAAYLPQKNPFDDNAYFSGVMLNTMGKEYEYVKTIYSLDMDGEPGDRVWTIFKDDDGNAVITNRFFNYLQMSYDILLGYIVTERPGPERGVINVVD